MATTIEQRVAQAAEPLQKPATKSHDELHMKREDGLRTAAIMTFYKLLSDESSAAAAAKAMMEQKCPVLLIQLMLDNGPILEAVTCCLAILANYAGKWTRFQPKIQRKRHSRSAI